MWPSSLKVFLFFLDCVTRGNVRLMALTVKHVVVKMTIMNYQVVLTFQKSDWICHPWELLVSHINTQNWSYSNDYKLDHARIISFPEQEIAKMTPAALRTCFYCITGRFHFKTFDNILSCLERCGFTETIIFFSNYYHLQSVRFEMFSVFTADMF